MVCMPVMVSIAYDVDYEFVRQLNDRGGEHASPMGADDERRAPRHSRRGDGSRALSCRCDGAAWTSFGDRYRHGLPRGNRVAGLRQYWCRRTARLGLWVVARPYQPLAGHALAASADDEPGHSRDRPLGGRLRLQATALSLGQRPKFAAARERAPAAALRVSAMSLPRALA